MARFILEPLGTERSAFVSEEEWNDRLVSAAERREPLEEARATVRAGWGQKYVDRVHQKGKLTTWERLELLGDSDGPWLPLGTLVNHGESFDGKTSPGAGVVTGLLKVEGRWVVVIANDNTVASGSWWPRSPEKIQRAQEVALRLRLPTIYLVDCSGLYLPKQATTFPGRTGAGAIFRMNSLLSAEGVPQIAGVHGDCIAGGGYMPIISDWVFMTEQAYMVIAGAALIKGSKGKAVTSLEIGGPDVHVHLSRCADHRVPDDEVLIERIRNVVATLPSSGCDYYRDASPTMEPIYDSQELEALLPPDHRMAYDMRQILARVLDQSLFKEFMPNIGKEMICGVGKVAGLWMGFIANNPELTDHPRKMGAKRPGGIFYREGIAKVSQFSRACNDDGIPIVWVQDISGFDIGEEAEKQGLLGYGSSLIYTNSTNTTPMFTILLRKASGAGYYAMAGHPYQPILQLATTHSRLAVMEGRTLSIGAFRTKLDDQFNIKSTDEKERNAIEEKMKALEGAITKDMDPYKAASQMDVDEVISPGELRKYLVGCAEISYQAIGHRRIKNPRIWSLHDLMVLEGNEG